MGPSSRHADQRVGTMLGKYRIESVLGVGGMAVVYVGVHRNGHRAALKVLHASAAFSEDLRARFVREAYTANAIEHPGIVRVLDDSTTEDGTPFLVMELLEGETLEQRISEAGESLPTDEVVAIARDVLDALSAAHERGVVHRDVKPANLFLTTAGAVKVLDFGIARVLGGDVSATQTGRTLGTPAFMSPEQALAIARDIDARTDVWAVAATMFYLLTKRYVHAAESAGSMLVAAGSKPAPPLLDVRADLRADLASIVDKGLAFDRKDRWASAAEMRAAIDALDLPRARPLGTNRAARKPVDELALDLALTVRASQRSRGVTAGGDDASPVARGRPKVRHRISRRLAGSVGSAARSQATTIDTGVASTLPSIPPPAPAANERTAASGAPPDAQAPASGARAPASGAASLRAAPSPARTIALLGGLAATTVALTVILRAPDEQPSPPPQPVAAASAKPGSSASPGTSAKPGTSANLGTSANPGAAARRACETNRECMDRLGGAAICRDACVSLDRPGCRLLAESNDVANDATVFLGAMYTAETSFASANLARRDFAEVASGLPPAKPGGPRRPLAIVACKDDDAPEETARWIADAVKAPIVLGFSLSKTAVDLTTAVFQPRGVLTLAGNQSTMLASLPRPAGEQRMLYRVSPSAALFARGMLDVVRTVWMPEIGEPSDVRVALTRVDNNTGVSYSDVVVSTLRMNGHPVSQVGARFRQFVVPPGAAGDATELAAKIAEFQPNVIIHTGGGQKLVEDVERVWPPLAARRPRWVTVGMLSNGYVPLVKARPDLRRRLLGVDTRTHQSSVAKFVLRHNEIHPVRIDALEAVGFPYDGVYLAAYLLTAIGDRPITGMELVSALPKLASGPAVDVGGGSIFTVFDALARGATVDLVGTTTDLEFDAESGDPPADMAVYCLGDAGRGRVEPRESALRLRSSATNSAPNDGTNDAPSEDLRSAIDCW